MLEPESGGFAAYLLVPRDLIGAATVIAAVFGVCARIHHKKIERGLRRSAETHLDHAVADTCKFGHIMIHEIPAAEFFVEVVHLLTGVPVMPVMFGIVIAERDAEIDFVFPEEIRKRLEREFEVTLRRRKFTPYDIARKHHKRRPVFRERASEKRFSLFGQPPLAAFEMNIGQLKKSEFPLCIEPYLRGIVTGPRYAHGNGRLDLCGSAAGHGRKRDGSGQKIPAVYFIHFDCLSG